MKRGAAAVALRGAVLGAAAVGAAVFMATPAAADRTEKAAIVIGSSRVVILRAPTTGRVLIRGGTFMMGSDIVEVTSAIARCRAEPGGRLCDALADKCLCSDEVFWDESPEHEVTLGPFEIDRREVIVSAYERCVELGPCSKRPTSAGGSRFNEPHLPVTMVTHQDATAYCGWVGGRLPTEAEWERAARGLTHRRYPWGNVWNPFLANAGRYAFEPFEDKDGFLELAPPASFPNGRTATGIVDMAGNVEEWVADWFDIYPIDPVTNPRGPERGDARVVRGGSFIHGAPWQRNASRGYDASSSRQIFRGFRCAYDPLGQ